MDINAIDVPKLQNDQPAMIACWMDNAGIA
jgi:hypothetical protein